MTWTRSRERNGVYSSPRPPSTVPVGNALAARRQRLLDRIVTAPGPAAATSEAIDVIAQAGNFPVQIQGMRDATTVAGLARYLRHQLPEITVEEVRPC